MKVGMKSESIISCFLTSQQVTYDFVLFLSQFREPNLTCQKCGILLKVFNYSTFVETNKLWTVLNNSDTVSRFVLMCAIIRGEG